METIFNNISTLVLAASVLISQFFKKRRSLGMILSALCYLTVIILRTLALRYSFSPAGIVIVVLAAVALFCLGVEAGGRSAAKRKNQPVGQNWTSVKEQPPQVESRVLVYTGTCSMIAVYKGDSKWTTDYHSHSCTVDDAFAHWMPLPGHPKT